MIFITPYGAGVSPDSTTYIYGAKNINLGNGFTVNKIPVTHFPPLYSLFLAGIDMWEDDPVQSARLLNAFLFGVNVVLVASAIYLVTGRNFLAVTCAALGFILSAQLLNLHSMAWSEPLFISFSLSCIILLSKCAERFNIFLWIGSAFLLGLALLTRYIGLALIPAALIVVLIECGSNQKSGKCIRNTLLWLGIACLPLAIWMIRNIVIAESATNRKFVFHLPDMDYLTTLILNLQNFIFPLPFSSGLKFIFFALSFVMLIFGTLLFLKHHSRLLDWHSTTVMLMLTCILFSASYLMFLLVSRSFFDAATPGDDRILSPVFVFLIVVIFSGTWIVLQTLEKPFLWPALFIFVSLLITFKLPDTLRVMLELRQNGSGYTSRQWNESDSIAYIKSLPNDIRIYTNGPDVLMFLTGKEASALPVKIFSNTRELNRQYMQDVTNMCKDIQEDNAMVVYLHTINWRWYLITEAEMVSACQPKLLKQLSDGRVYAGK